MKMVQLRRIASIINGGTPTPDPEHWEGSVAWATPVDLGQHNGKSIRQTLRTLTPAGLKSGSASVTANSVLLSTRAPVGYVARTDVPMAFNQGCKGLELQQGTDPRFLVYVLTHLVPEMRSLATGTTFLELSSSKLASLRVPVCSPKEQRTIADFLDRETAQINAMIDAQQKVVALAEERRAGSIAEEIDSLSSQGHPLVQLRHCLTIQNGVTLGKNYGDEGLEYPYLRVANVQAGYLDLEEIKTVSVSPAVAAGSTLRNGDVLITEGGDRAALGRGALWRDEIPGALHQNHIFALRCGADLDPQFLVYALDAPSARIYFESTRRQTTNLSSTNSSKVKAFKIPLPPVTVQREIVDKLQTELARVDEIRSAATEVTTLLRERREALIAAAVTGRLDPETGIERIDHPDHADHFALVNA
ncbi:restriction endonuclease subunit S [Corynebacterium qintianiae]|uniref:restriction endonuclease subunit S n=1 Tax=Corynebacterium qintianiae TaxID=2709392 RepID=UPI0013EB5451|nr:restriction endonuclease subunit S [Corynebacterium qintianiae]